MERTNTDRAERALNALDSQQYGEQGFDLMTDPEMAHQAVKDLLGDLRHFCDRAGVDYADADRGGYRMYCEERAEDPAGGWPLAPPHAPVVVIVRHPDHANDVEIFPGVEAPVVLDVDLGSQFDGTADDAEQYAAWRVDMEQAYRDSGLPIDHPAYEAYMRAVESADPSADSGLTSMQVAAVTFEDRSGRRTAVARLADGSTERLFTFYDDELSFTEAELVGLTVEQARALHHERDVAYLQDRSS